MSRIKRKQIDLNLSDGPTDGTYGITNSPGLLNSDKMEDAFDKIVTILDQLSPGRPQALSNAVPFTSPSYVGYITGLTANTAMRVTNITGNTQFPFVSDRAPGPASGPPIPNLFQDGSQGFLSIVGEAATVDIAAYNAGTASGAVVTATGRTVKVDFTADYWAGVTGRAGFWRGIAATFIDKQQSPSTTEYSFVGQHTLNKNGSGVTGQHNFRYYVEATTLPSLNSVTLAPTPYAYTSNRVVSGVPVMTSTDKFNLRLDMSYVSKFFYVLNPLTPVSATLRETAAWVWPTPPATNAMQTGTNAVSHTMYPVAGVYSDAVVNRTVLTFTASDVLQQTSVRTLDNTATSRIRIDSVSLTSNDQRRLLSNSIFDRTLSASYDHTQKLVGNGAYNAELMLEGGAYVYPTKNYSVYYPLLDTGVSRDYSGQTGLRMATWHVGTVTNGNKICVTTPGLTQLQSDATFRVLVLVGNPGSWQTPWLDAGLKYDGEAIQQAALSDATTASNGAASLELATSTATARNVFVKASGTTTPNVTYNVYVRVVWGETRTFAMTGRPVLSLPTGGLGTINAY